MRAGEEWGEGGKKKKRGNGGGRERLRERYTVDREGGRSNCLAKTSYSTILCTKLSGQKL
jgi:hypothetical protein